MPLIRLIALIAALLAAIAPAAAPAQDWPNRPVTLVVPFAPAGAFDVMARVFTPYLTQFWGQQVIVENVGAAAGIVGTHPYNPSLYKKLPYNAVTDFAPVALVAEQPMVLITRKDFPADTLPEFIAYVKANAAKLQYG